MGPDGEGDERKPGRLDMPGRALALLLCLHLDMDEYPVLSIGRGGTGTLSDDREDSLALLSRAFGDELLQPEAEAPQAR